MTMNKWTVGLAAAGLLSLTSVAQAQVATKLATTSLSGYVSTTYQWQPAAGGYTTWANGGGKIDNFGLDVVSLSIGSPVSATATGWQAGYNVQLWAGPDAGDLATDSTGTNDNDFAIKQAYVAMRAPLGKGLNLAVGVFNTILGRDDADRNVNNHYSHSLAWQYLEPSQHTGLKASYQLHELVGVTALVANTRDAKINGDDSSTSDRQTLGLALSLKAPASAGFLKDATVDAAYISGFTGSDTLSLKSYYVNVSIPTPIKNLTAAVSLDVVSRTGNGNDDSVLGLHAKYKLSDKASLALRFENLQDGASATLGTNSNAKDVTATLQYDLFANVISRLEYRRTHLDGASAANRTSESVFANLIYQF